MVLPVSEKTLRAAMRGKAAPLVWEDRGGSPTAPAPYPRRLASGVPIDMRTSNARRAPCRPGGPRPVDRDEQKRHERERAGMTAEKRARIFADATAAGWVVSYRGDLALRSWCYECDAHHRADEEHRPPLSKDVGEEWGRVVRAANPDLAGGGA